MARTTDRVYADASALVKLLVDEPETPALRREIRTVGQLVTSKIALVEVSRATALANASPEMAERTRLLLASCMLIAVTDDVLRQARELTSRQLRALDAVHLASALILGVGRFVAYDRQLLAAAATRGLAVSHPGLKL